FQHNFAQSAKPLYTKQVYFEFNKYAIRPSEDRALTSFLRAVKAQTADYTIKLVGHTDNIDNDQYNQQLGLKRAKAIKEYLVGKGIPADIIKTESKGEKIAVKDNSTDTGRAINRRVEMELIAGGSGGGTKDGGIYLTGNAYDAATNDLVKATITVSIQKPKEFDKDKTKNHKDASAYIQPVIANRTYTVYATADGYRAETYTVTVPEHQKNGTITQHVHLKKLDIKQRLTYEKIYFVPNKDEFLTTAHEDLQKLLKFMESDSLANIEIRGHINYPHQRTKMTPFEEYLFYDLSLRRAVAVYNYLAHFGIKKERMSYRGMSNKEMVLPYAKTVEECMRNMRVEVLVLN
ncbi:MAG TPA: OmpA family protein, partial [Bacteroidia bacterium]|nr:OmpA family protein [Bacteroidia bacterium]